MIEIVLLKGYKSRLYMRTCHQPTIIPLLFFFQSLTLAPYQGSLADCMLSLFMSIANGVSWQEVIEPVTGTKKLSYWIETQNRRWSVVGFQGQLGGGFKHFWIFYPDP